MMNTYFKGNGIFQERNTTCHVTRIIRDWFKEGDGSTLPLNSLDLINPMVLSLLKFSLKFNNWRGKESIHETPFMLITSSVLLALQQVRLG